MSLPSPSTGVISRDVIVSFDFEGYSRNTEAPAGYEYLKSTRRIKYVCQIILQIGYDFPFVYPEEFRDKMQLAAQESSNFLGELKTFGVIAEYLLDYVLSMYPDAPKIYVTVGDGQVGEVAEYVANVQNDTLEYISSVRTWNRTIGAHILLQRAKELTPKV